MTTEITQARVSGTLNPIVGHGQFSVQVRLRGKPCGEYRHGTRQQAESHAQDGRDKLGALGFTYRVVPNSALDVTSPTRTKPTSPETL